MAKWIKDFVMDLPLQPNGRMRMDCPACGKKNTFSVGEESGVRLYHCFHADCTASGRTGFRLTKDVTTHPMLLKRNNKGDTTVTYCATFEMPSTFVPITVAKNQWTTLKEYMLTMLI